MRRKTEHAHNRMKSGTEKPRAPDFPRGSLLPTSANSLHQPITLLCKKMSRLMLTDNFTNQHIASTVISLVKQITGSNWAEFLMIEGNQLKICTTLTGKQKDNKQKFSVLPISDESLPGYVTVIKESRIINNAKTSSLYQSFKYRLSSFDLRFLEPEEPQSLACVPFFDAKGEVFAVVHLLDKVDEYNSLSFFTNDDLVLVESVGELLRGILAMRDKNQSDSRQLEKLSYFDNEKHHLSASSLQLVRKQSLMKALKQLLESTKVMTYEYLDLMTEVMESEAAILHLVTKEGVMVPWIAFKISLVCGPSDEVKALCTRTSEYLKTENQEVLIVRDYSKEKHFSSITFAYWEKQYASSLSLPILEEGHVLGVIEFYKSSNEFNFRDEHVAKELVSYLSTFGSDHFYSRLPLTGRKDKVTAKPYKYFGQAALQSMRQFSMRPESFDYDFVGFMKQVRNSIRDLVKLESCNVYIKDGLTSSLWTWVSYNCQPLSIPIEPYSLIGFSTLKQMVINEKFPCGLMELDNIAETQSMAGQAALIVPVIGEVLKNQVLAVIIISRREEKFSMEEILLIQRLGQTIALSLEYLFFSQYDLEEYSPSQYATDSLIERRKKDRNFTVQPGLVMSKAVSIDDMQYYTEVKESRDLQLERNESAEVTQSHLLKCLCQLSELSLPRFQALKDWFGKIGRRADQSLDLILRGIPNLIQCQHAKIFIYDEAHQYLKDTESQVLSKATGLVKQVLVTGMPLVLNASAHANPVYNEYIDSLGSKTSIETYMAVPIFYLYDEVIGVMVFVNSPTYFSPEDLAIAQFLSLIPSKAMLDVDDSIKKWNDVLKQGLRQQMLLAWCKQIMTVSAICQQNISSMKEIVHQLTTNSDFVMIMKALIEVISANMNVEDVQILVRHNEGHISAFTKDMGLQLLQPGPELETKKDGLRTGQPKIIYEHMFGKVNTLLVPIRLGAEVVGGIELHNKRDATLSNYCNFTKEDEVFAQSYAASLGDPMFHWLSDERVDTTDLQRVIRQAASTVNAYPLMSIIRKASQVLLNCDRATIFIRDKDNMVVSAQGTEQEIPVGYSVPVGTGIVGYVAKNCQTVNIPDAYNDPRFNQEVDKRTGYRTSNMLCVPVFDSQHQVIAALQMINKRQGAFNDDDLTILDMFSDVISSALQIFDRFKSVVVERTRLLHILTSIGSYILVINKEGKLDYCNLKFESLFGIPEEVGRSRHFSFWLRDNADIIRDLQSVIDVPNTKVAKQFQKLYPSRQRRSASITIAAASSVDKLLHVHYSISSMQDFTTQESVGLIFILEDVTQIVNMKKEMKKIKTKLREINVTNVVQAKTGLHSCISSLQVLHDNYHSLSPESATEAILKVISVLKSGNLERAEVVFDEVGLQLSADLKSFINTEYLGRDSDVSPDIQFAAPLSPCLLPDSDVATNTSELHNWNLNVWDLGDLFPYVFSILSECDLLRKFTIKQTTLNNFLLEIKRLYDQRGNPFHNFYHGFSVMHSTYCLLTSTRTGALYQAEDLLAVLVAALCHDVDHTGRTNSFEVSKGSNLALLYHDASVLEQHHAAIAFFTMQQESCNIFKSIPKSTFLTIRKIIIAGILATDMSKHFAMIANMNERFKDLVHCPLGSKDTDKMAIIELLVHCSDLAHPTKAFDLCLRWSLLVRQEFISQAKEEATLGLLVTPYMKDLEDTRSYVKNEIGFTTAIVLPLWEAVNRGLQPHIEQQMQNLTDNIQNYKKKLMEEDQPIFSVATTE